MSKNIWIPTSSCTFPPEAIPLGQVVCDPTQPHRPLSLHSIPVNAWERLAVQQEVNWKMEWSNHRSFASNLWAKAFVGEMGSGINTESEAKATYSFAKMRNQSPTMSIDDNFARRVLADAEVQEFLAKTKYKQPIFVVTGVILGEMGTVVMEKRAEAHGWVSGLSGRSSSQQSTRFDVKGTVVLAYKMCRISVQSAGASPVVKEYGKGAKWS